MTPHQPFLVNLLTAEVIVRRRPTTNARGSSSQLGGARGPEMKTSRGIESYGVR